MLNLIKGSTNRVISDVRAERLFRAAEDDFFYFNKPDEAVKKLEKALAFLPTMTKALLMSANIAILDGELDLALMFYKRAEGFDSENVKILAGLANIYEMKNENDKALEYIEKALAACVSFCSPLNKALVDLKISVLFKQKKYLEVQKTINNSKLFLKEDDYIDLKINNLKVLKQKLLMQKKLKQINLTIVK